MTCNDVASAARAYLGARWLHQGRRPDAMDCLGLVLRSAWDLGVSDFDITGYGLQPSDESMLDMCREHLREISRSQLQAGDVVVMRFGANRHMGVVG